MASYAEAAARAPPQGNDPFQRIAADAARRAREPALAFRSSAIPGDMPEDQRKQLVQPLSDRLAEALRARNLGDLVADNRELPFTVTFVSAPGGALDAPQQCALLVTALTPQVGGVFTQVFSRGLRTFSHGNLSLTFRPDTGVAVDGWRALLLGWPPEWALSADLRAVLNSEFNWHVTKVTRVYGLAKRMPTNKATVWVSNPPPASFEEAPRELVIGDLKLLLRYPGVPHLQRPAARTTAPADPPRAHAAPEAAGGAVAAAPTTTTTTTPAPAPEAGAGPSVAVAPHVGVDATVGTTTHPSAPATHAVVDPTAAAAAPVPLVADAPGSPDAPAVARATTTSGSASVTEAAAGPSAAAAVSVEEAVVATTTTTTTPSTAPVEEGIARPHTPVTGVPTAGALSAAGGAVSPVVMAPSSSKHAANFSDDEEGYPGPRSRKLRVGTPEGKGKEPMRTRTPSPCPSPSYMNEEGTQTPLSGSSPRAVFSPDPEPDDAEDPCGCWIGRRPMCDG
jgi:hypothetical protein